jgi:hypothetical protein
MGSPPHGVIVVRPEPSDARHEERLVLFEKGATRWKHLTMHYS